MKIVKQNIFGGQQQFADSIINASGGILTSEDAGLLKLVDEKSKSDSQKAELVQALTVIKDDSKDNASKEAPKALWRKFLETSVGTLAEEAMKGLASPTFWALLFS